MCAPNCKLEAWQLCTGSGYWHCTLITRQGSPRREPRCHPRRTRFSPRPARHHRGFFARAIFRDPQFRPRRGPVEQNLAQRLRLPTPALRPRAPGDQSPAQRTRLHEGLHLCVIRAHVLRLRPRFLRRLVARCPSTCQQDHLHRRRLRCAPCSGARTGVAAPGKVENSNHSLQSLFHMHAADTCIYPDHSGSAGGVCSLCSHSLGLLREGSWPLGPSSMGTLPTLTTALALASSSADAPAPSTA